MNKRLVSLAVALLLSGCGGSAAPASAPAAPASAPSSPSSAAVTRPSGSAAPAGASAPSNAGAKPAASAGQLKQIKIATPIVGSAFSYLYAARDLGLFKAHGLDAQIIAMPPANAVAALQSGDLDYAATVGSVIRSALKGIPERVVTIAANRPNFVILGAKGTTSIDQLKGKVVAVDAAGSTSYVMLTELLKRKGLASGSYQTVAANSDEARALLVENGQATACILDVSNGLRLQAEGYPLLAQVADFPEAPFSGLGAATSAIQKNRPLLEAGLQATLEGVAAMRNRKAEVVPIMAKALNISQDQESAVYDAMKDVWTTDGKASDAANDFEFTNDQQALELKTKPTADQVYDFSMLDEVNKK
ncbi:MAG TPA: ABC transporter substrate-binding protein [Chloroflexota bacterium]|nr:ABC transporter substrate-binding protein [Chloroflexota bacterium]